MGFAPFPYVYTTLGFQLLSVIVATGYDSRISAIMRLDHEKEPHYTHLKGPFDTHKQV